MQVRRALAELDLFVNSTNAWTTFTVNDLASALSLIPQTVNEHLRRLIRAGYLEERATHRRTGEREARLTHPPVLSHGAPGAQAR